MSEPNAAREAAAAGEGESSAADPLIATDANAAAVPVAGQENEVEY